MARYPVFNDKYCCGCLGMSDKQRIVTYAKADKYIKIGLFLVEYLCLHYRITHRFVLRALGKGIFGRYAYLGFFDSTYLTADSVIFDIVLFEYLCKNARFVQKTDTGSYADFFAP